MVTRTPTCHLSKPFACSRSTIRHGPSASPSIWPLPLPRYLFSYILRTVPRGILILNKRFEVLFIRWVIMTQEVSNICTNIRPVRPLCLGKVLQLLTTRIRQLSNADTHDVNTREFSFIFWRYNSSFETLSLSGPLLRTDLVGFIIDCLHNCWIKQRLHIPCSQKTCNVLIACAHGLENVIYLTGRLLLLRFLVCIAVLTRSTKGRCLLCRRRTTRFVFNIRIIRNRLTNLIIS